MTEKPKVQNSASAKELDKVQTQFEAFDNQVKEMTMDRMNMAPKKETEPQTKLSQKDIEKSKDIYLKPSRTIGCRDKFNEAYRDQYNFDKEYVKFIAENKEIIGEKIEIWTRPYGGMSAEFWEVPVNTPVFGPRYLAEQIKRKFYHRMIMKQNVVSDDGMTQMYGQMAVDTTVPRLEARPVSNNKSVFMGAVNF